MIIIRLLFIVPVIILGTCTVFNFIKNDTINKIFIWKCKELHQGQIKKEPIINQLSCKY